MKNIKYWIYYLKDTDEPYAYTDNKSYAKLFESDRDMKLFNRIKKIVNKEEINYFAKEFQNKILNEYELKIFDKHRKRWMTGKFIFTVDEYITISNAEIQFTEVYICQHCWYNPCVFNTKIFKALEILEYNNVYRYLTTTVTDDNCDYYDTGIKIKPDLLGIFLYYYGKTMKGIE